MMMRIELEILLFPEAGGSVKGSNLWDICLQSPVLHKIIYLSNLSQEKSDRILHHKK